MSPLSPPLPAAGAKGAIGGAPLLRVVVLAVILFLALLAILASWWITGARGRAADRRDFALRSAQLAGTADRVAQTVTKRLSDSQVPIDLDGLKTRKQEQARAQQAQDRPAISNAAPAQVSDLIKFRLRGVVPTGAHPVAFIDDHTVGLGEEVSGFKVVAIAAESVTFIDPLGHRRVVKLYGD